jgi:hypothetical protein
MGGGFSITLENFSSGVEIPLDHSSGRGISIESFSGITLDISIGMVYV